MSERRTRIRRMHFVPFVVCGLAAVLFASWRPFQAPLIFLFFFLAVLPLCAIFGFVANQFPKDLERGLPEG